MATLLYALGRFSARCPWLVIVSGLLILGLAGGTYAAFSGTLSTGFDIPDTATQKVGDQLAEEFPSIGGGAGAVVFTTESESGFTEVQKAQVAELLGRVSEVDGVIGVTDPFVTEAQLQDQRSQMEQGRAQIADAEVALAAGQAELDAQAAQLEDGGAQLEARQSALDEVREELAAQSRNLEDGAGLLALTEGMRQVSEDGSTAFAMVQFEDMATALPAEVKEAVNDKIQSNSIDGIEIFAAGEISAEIPSIVGPGEAAGVMVAAIVLFVMLGTLIGAGLPLVTALIGVGIGILASLSLSAVVDMMSLTPILGMMVGLAVGIDYSLFIINRHRKQLRQGMGMHESIGLANGTSGNAVVFAGSTVVIALLALNIVGIPFVGVMGTVGAVCVAIAVLIAVTMTPAMLSLVGTRLLPKKERESATPKRTKPAPERPMSNRSAILTVVGSVAALLVIAIPALDMRLGLNTSAAEPEDSSAYRAYDTLNKQFGPGVMGALVVVADLDGAVPEDELLSEQLRVGTVLKDQDSVVAVVPIGISQDGTMLAFQVVPEGGPTDVTTETLVQDIRDLAAEGVASFGVAGNASGNMDISAKLSDALPVYFAVVVGLSLLILIVVFRSILVPLSATLGFVLSMLAMFGGLTAVFQWGWFSDIFGIHEPAPVLSLLPVVAIGVLFGLAMDYQLFLVSGMREAHSRGDSARLAVRRGLHAGRNVVIAAALIMVSVFAGFIFAESALVKSFGFALALGVLADAFLVRLLLIPAIMHLLGESAWWLPKWLDRILPNVDVEGASLERRHPVLVEDLTKQLA